MVVLYGHFTRRAFELLAHERSANFVDLERTGLFDSLLPQVNSHAREVHRAAGDAAFRIDARDLVIHSGDLRLLEPGLKSFTNFVFLGDLMDMKYLQQPRWPMRAFRGKPPNSSSEIENDQTGKF